MTMQGIKSKQPSAKLVDIVALCMVFFFLYSHRRMFACVVAYLWKGTQETHSGRCLWNGGLGGWLAGDQDPAEA